MKTQITHNKPSPFYRQVFKASDGKKALDLPSDAVSATVFVGPGNCTSVDFFRNPEPEPIPMSEMQPGDKAVVVTASAGAIGEGRVGDVVIMPVDTGFAVRLTDGKYLICGNYTVRILQPDESLTIKVVKDGVGCTTCVDNDIVTRRDDQSLCAECTDNANWAASGAAPAVIEKFGENPSADDDMHIEVTSEPEPKYEITRNEPLVELTGGFDVRLVDAPDDQFERLADGTRMCCDNCGDGPKQGDNNCNRDGGSQLETDDRGESRCAHPCWRPIEPTLDAALRTGTAEDALATFGDDPDWEDVWSELRDATTRLFGDLFDVARGQLHCRSTLVQADCIDLVREVVSIRDRLGLFGEENHGD